MAELDDRNYKLEARFFDKRDRPTEHVASVTLMARRYLELMEHEEYHVSAEGPRGDGFDGMTGLDEWEIEDSGTRFSSVASDMKELKFDVLWKDDSEDLRMLKSRWASRLSYEQIRQGDEILSAYSDFHRQVMKDKSLWRSNNFLIYRTMDRGLGNQLESLVSAFAMALLTNRVFLVDSTTIHHLLRPPPGLLWHYSTIADNLSHDYIYDNSKLLDLRWQNPLEFPNLLCKDVAQVYTKRFLFIFSDQYFLPALMHNALYRSTLQSWFGEDLFGVLLRHLMRPKEIIVKQAVSFYREHLEGRPSVGIQLRTATMKGHDLTELVHGMDAFAWKDWINSFWKCALLSSPKRAGTAYFIASDSAKAKKLADGTLGNQSFWYKQIITRSTISGHATALIDLLVLSMCDDLVTTTMSTFGYVPAGLINKPAFVVSYQSTCLREVTSQPCFHKWGYLMEAECYDKMEMISPEVRVCGLYSPPNLLPDAVM